MPRMKISCDREEISDLCFPVIVEGWGNQNFGRVKRKWLETFDKKEREKARYWYTIFYKWHLIKGVPESRAFFPEDLVFIDKLVRFFAEI